MAPCAGRRLAVAIAKEFEGAEIVRAGGVFAVSLVPAGGEALPPPGGPLDRERYWLAPSGCPVARAAVGYMDCSVVDAVDLGDFVLTVGECRAAAVLHPERDNLTVNEIQRRGVPADAETRLPFQGFHDSGEGIAPAPVQGADMAAVYARRRWGLFALTAGERLSVTGRAAQCSHEPPRMWVAAGGEDAAAIRREGRFGLSLLAEDQLPFAVQLARGVQPPTATLKEAARGVAHFVCAVEGELSGGVFHGPVTAFDWDRPGSAQLRADRLAAALP